MQAVRGLLVVLVLLGALGIGAQSRAATLALHSGANDPTSEGWTKVSNPNSVFAGPELNDQNSGLDAWKIDDFGAGFLFYSRVITSTDNANATANGWRLSARLRIVDTSGGNIGVDASPFMAYRNGTTNYQIHFRADADGDPIAYMATSFSPPAGAQFTLQGGGSGYHLYELDFNPATGTSLSIDGTVALSSAVGSPLDSGAVVLFGAGSSSPTGQANFNLVQFESPIPVSIVPVPATLPLLLVGLGGLGIVGSRKRR